MATFLPSEPPISGNPKLPLEILDEIMENLNGETSSLLNLALVCRYTLQKGRALVFETLNFSSGSDSHKFDHFLDLLEGPPTTIAFSVKSIHISDLFHRFYKYKPRNATHLLASKLPHLHSLRLSSFTWPFLPRHLHDFFFALPARDVSIESVVFYSTAHLVELFSSPLVSRKNQRLTLYDVQLDDENLGLSSHSHVFQRDIHLRAIDSITLLQFQEVWDLGRSNAKLTVDTFHLRLHGSGSRVKQTDLPYLRRFLTQIGSTLDGLFVDILEPEDAQVMAQYKQVDLLGCTALKVVHLGIIDLDQGQVAHMDTVWTILESIPPITVETVGLVFDARASFEHLPASLYSFDWVATIRRIQVVFPSLKQIKIKIGGYDLSKDYLTTQVDALAHDICQRVSSPIFFEACSWTSIHVSLVHLEVLPHVDALRREEVQIGIV
ncbi:hypothetical protein C0991_010541 [Blastosporella zonata]|nr:hypothetical protein C0991_010541 [Blastosporella zonata]